MSRDIRRYARQTNVQLIVGALLLLFLVGDGLIWWIYGKPAALMGLMCLFAGLVPVVLLVLLFFLMEWILRHATHD